MGGIHRQGFIVTGNKHLTDVPNSKICSYADGQVPQNAVLLTAKSTCCGNSKVRSPACWALSSISEAADILWHLTHQHYSKTLLTKLLGTGKHKLVGTGKHQSR